MPSPPAFRANPQTPQFLWNEKAAQYIDRSTGRFVARTVIRNELDRVIDASGEAMIDLSRQLQKGAIDLAEWQTRMMQQIKTTHLAAAAMQRGGWAQMTQGDYGRVGRIVRRQYEFLRQFAGQIAEGTQRLDGTLISRADLYGQAGRTTYYNFWNVEMDKRGYDEGRSVLDPGAQHCTQCLSEAAMGFKPLADIVPIGTRICLSHDRCSMEYRNSLTGATARA